MQFRLERSANQRATDRDLQSIRIGGYRGEWGLLLDYGAFLEQTGGSYIAIDRRYQEALLWGHWRSAQFEIAQPYFGLGLGAYRESAQTHFAGEVESQYGSLRPLAGLGAGVRWVFWKFVLVETEMRFTFGDGFSPNPQIGGVVQAGLTF
jgi:hypothetical protein